MTYPEIAKKFQAVHGKQIAFTDKEYRETLINVGSCLDYVETETDSSRLV